MPRIVLLSLALCCIGSAISAGGELDSLSSGIAAYRAGNADSALVLLAGEIANPYIEAVRLKYRAETFFRDSLYRECSAELERLLALVEHGKIVAGHDLIPYARDRSIESLARCGTCIPFDEFPFEFQRCSARSLFVVSATCLAGGNEQDAMRYFLEGTHAEPSIADSALYRKLMRGFGRQLDTLSCERLMDIARGAAALGLFAEANGVVDRLLETDAENYEALLCKGLVLAQAGDTRRARHALWSLFYSSAPVPLKQQALLGIASCAYRKKEYGNAGKYYRMFGMYYPNDKRSAQALDTAARIAVLDRRWKTALELWTDVRRRHRHGVIWGEAGLSEAVLRAWLGKHGDAHRVLSELLPWINEDTAPAVIYWLALTSADEGERHTWTDSLYERFPHSWYSAVLKDDSLSLFSPDGSTAHGADIAGLESNERRLIDSIGSEIVPDDSLLAHPACEAYRYFLDHALVEEAEQSARAVTRALEPKLERIFMIYRWARENGCIDLSFALLNKGAAAGHAFAFPWELWYPAAYTGVINERAAAAGIPADVILSIIREESRFDEKAVSSDNARGLMQLIPSTAAWIARRGETGAIAEADLFDPSLNVALGVSYFEYLLRRPGGSLIGALAAYNGGEGRMAAWSANFRPSENPVVAIEMIGPRETRLYVKKVLETLSAYRAISGKREGRP